MAWLILFTKGITAVTNNMDSIKNGNRSNEMNKKRNEEKHTSS